MNKKAKEAIEALMNTIDKDIACKRIKAL
jgi:hypothetical protein